MSLRDYLQTFARHLLLMIVVVIVVISISVAYLLIARPSYAGESKVFISTSSANTLSDLSQGGAFAQQVVKSYGDVATTPLVLEPVIRSLNLESTPAALAQRITITAPANETILNITVSDRSPSQAADIANGIALQLARTVVTLTPDTGNGQASVKVTQLQTAQPATSPTTPNKTLTVVLGLLIGVALAALLALAREALVTRIRGTHDVALATREPVIGLIPFDSGTSTQPIVAQERGQRAEAYKSLRTSLHFALARERRAIVVTSSVPSEGKSTTAANLAVAYALAERKVLVIDADLRRPRLHTYFGIEGGTGLSNFLIGDVGLVEVIQSWSIPNLFVLPAGQQPPNPNELLQSKAMEDLIASVVGQYDILILDSPPALAVADAAVLAGMNTAILMVVGAGRVKRNQLTASVDRMTQVGAHVLGIVLNLAPQKSSAGYGYGYGYGYESSDPGS